MTTLKLCPCCRNYNLIIEKIPLSDWYYVNCLYARGGCGMNGAWGNGIEEAAQKWNDLPRREVEP